MSGEKHCDVFSETSQCFEQNITVFFYPMPATVQRVYFTSCKPACFIVAAGYG